MGELHGEPKNQIVSASQHLLTDIIDIFYQKEQDNNDEPPAIHGHFKLGWIQGVLIPCLLNIWGVMLFLRLSWVVGQSGVIETLIIIGISTLVSN